MWSIRLEIPASDTLSIGSPRPLLATILLKRVYRKRPPTYTPSLLCLTCSLPSSSLSPTLHSGTHHTQPPFQFLTPPHPCGLSNMVLGPHAQLWVHTKGGMKVQGSAHDSVEKGCCSNQAAALCQVWACVFIHKIPVPFTRDPTTILLMRSLEF